MAARVLCRVSFAGSKYKFVHAKVRNYSKEIANSVPALKWNVFGSILLERKPIISRQMTVLEQHFQQLLSAVELEMSLLNDHELRHLEDEKRRERLKTSDISDADLEAATIQTAQDFEDAANEQFARFQPIECSLDTENDNRHSLKRHLDRSLLLLTKMRHSGEWEVPTVMHSPGNTLRQTAEECARQYFGPELRTTILGNAPVAFHQFTYGRKLRQTDTVNNSDGGKVFFYRAHYVKGTIQLSTSGEVLDYMWATRSELDQVLKSKRAYLRSVKSALTDEDFVYRLTNRAVAVRELNHREKQCIN